MWTFNKNYLLSVLGLCCCEQAFSSCGKQELLPSYGVWAIAQIFTVWATREAPNITLYVCTSLFLSIQQSMNTWVASIAYLLY